MNCGPIFSPAGEAPQATAIPSTAGCALHAAVLAAGRGCRLGGVLKAGLEVGGEPVLARVVRALRAGGVKQVSVVAGPYLNVLMPLADSLDAPLWVLPESPEGTANQGSLADSQRWAAQQHVRLYPGCDLMLLVGDLPLLSGNEVAWLRRQWAARSPRMEAMVPVVRGQRGHPVMLSAHVAQSVARLEAPEGVRDWMARHSEQVAMELATGEGHVTDLDTPEDLARLRTRCR